ncbi:MAG: hypothetical protein O3A29_16345 [Planctomycetota bacterium]|nr:hypothetical protein [Planctomycetota bacterium]
MWKSTPATFTSTVADWLPLMSNNRDSESDENKNAKVTANSAGLSLDPLGTSADQTESDNQTGVATLSGSPLASRLPWPLDRGWHDSSAPPSTDPFLESESEATLDAAAEVAIAELNDVVRLDDDFDFSADAVHQGYEALPPPGDDADFPIASIEDGKRGVDSIPPSTDRIAEDTALVQLRDLLAEEESTNQPKPAAQVEIGLAENNAPVEKEVADIDQKGDLIRKRVESLLETARDSMLLGNLDDAQRLCLQAQSMARSSAMPLNFRVSPVELLREIENRQTDAAIQLEEMVKNRDSGQQPPVDPILTASLSSVTTANRRAKSSDDLQRLMAEHKSDSSMASSEQEMPRKYRRLSSANIAEDPNVDIDDLTQRNANVPRDLSDSPSTFSGTGSSARLIANGSARLLDNQVSPMSLSVPFEEPRRSEAPSSASFLPHEWNQWDTIDEFGEEQTVEDKSNRSGVSQDSAHSDDQFDFAGTSTQPTRLSDISWDDESSDSSKSASEDDTQWKLMLGLICLLIGLSAASLVRHSRRNVPVAIPVDRAIATATPLSK